MGISTSNKFTETIEQIQRNTLVKKEKILILGCNGFLGSHLVNYFSSLLYEIYGCDLSAPSNNNFRFYKISDINFDLKNIFLVEQFDFCINAAGNGNVNFSILHPNKDFETNTILTFQILECLRLYNPSCKFIYISSAAVYGNPEKLPIKEYDSTNPISPYGWHKLISEKICREYYELYKINSIILRPFSVFGPGLRKQLFWDIYQKYKLNKSYIQLVGNPYNSRDFIFVEEFVSIVRFLMHHAKMEAYIYNVGTGIETTIETAMNEFFMRFERKPIIQYSGEQKKGYPENWRADIQKLLNLGYSFSHSFEAGITKTTDWLTSQL